MITNDIDLRITFQPLEKERSAYRANIPGLSIRLTGGQICSAKDLSAGGTSFVPPEGLTFHQHQPLVLDILVAGRVYIQAIECVVVWANSSATACAFRALTRVQETRLDKLVLETQKRLIARRRAEEEVLRDQMQSTQEGEEDEKNTGPILLDE